MSRASRSLQSRLMFGSVLSVSLVIMAASAALYWMVRVRLYRQFDSSLIDEAHAITTAFERGPHGIDLDLENMHNPQFTSPRGNAFYEVFAEDGSVLGRSPSLQNGQLIDRAGPVEQAKTMDVALPDARRGRMVLLTVTPEAEGSAPALTGPAPRVTLALAHATTHIDSSLSQLRWVLMLLWLATVAALAGVLAAVVRAGLAPAKILADRIGGVDERTLMKPIDLPNVPAELEPIVTRLNDLLGRLDAAFVRERTLLADVAHELRTPLSGLRSTLEVSLGRSRDAASYREDLERCLAISTSMQTLVENLLTMARLEAGQTPVHAVPIDVTAMIEDCWQSLSDIAGQRELHVSQSVVDGLTLVTDSAKLRIVLRNLLDNAVHHVNPAGHVHIAAKAADRELILRISNTGCEMDAADAERVFDRFWRADSSRSGSGRHVGLGLPLCRQIVQLLDGSIAVRCERGGEFAVTVKLPDHAAANSTTNHGDHS